jgi:hypothetical protein
MAGLGTLTSFAKQEYWCIQLDVQGTFLTFIAMHLKPLLFGGQMTGTHKTLGDVGPFLFLFQFGGGWKTFLFTCKL